MISAFQNCSKFEDRTYFGKSHYPKENINMLSHSVSDKVLQNKKWTTLINVQDIYDQTNISKDLFAI